MSADDLAFELFKTERRLTDLSLANAEVRAATLRSARRRVAMVAIAVVSVAALTVAIIAWAAPRTVPSIETFAHDYPNMTVFNAGEMQGCKFANFADGDISIHLATDALHRPSEMIISGPAAKESRIREIAERYVGSIDFWPATAQFQWRRTGVLFHTVSVRDSQIHYWVQIAPKHLPVEDR